MADVRHRIELTFDGGVLTGKLICPPDGCCDEDYKAGYCPARDWFDNTTVEEIVKGKVTVPVAIEWGPGEDDGPTFVVESDMAEAIREVAIPSLRYCEERYGHDDQARLNLEAAIGDREGVISLPGPQEAIRNQIIGYLKGRSVEMLKSADGADDPLRVEHEAELLESAAAILLREAGGKLASGDEPATGVGGSA